MKGMVNPNARFGTMPVFLTALSTILGAILFLRFGWAVGQVGFLGVIGIIVLGHLVTIPTAMAVAEIATNQRVQGGGAYFIISRSFGLDVGAAIGLALYLSQSVSVAFYIIAFGEAFSPFFEWLMERYGLGITDMRFITIPTMATLSYIMLTRGANIGMKALYWVVGVLLLSLAFFFLGNRPGEPVTLDLSAKIANGESFFFVFTIVFPAFTGLAAGLGLSGDLKNPEKSIPKGTIWATVAGLAVYIFAAYKFAISASPEELVADQLIMRKIALWGPIVPIGLAAASLSSALGSIMIAPRTLQAMGADDIFPQIKVNRWFAKGVKENNEPVNASAITITIAFIFVFVGDVNFVAQIISMFFMIIYGAICLISLLEHFAADPAYRPSFQSSWPVSLIGTIFSFWIMFKMNWPYASLSIFIMALMYRTITKSKRERRGFNKLFRGVVFQLSRRLQVFAQRASREDEEVGWRPFAICISCDTFKRQSAFNFMQWLSYRHGFGTYIHFIKGVLNSRTTIESKKTLDKLIRLASKHTNRVYLDTIISPSYTSAIAQVVQLSGISGRGNNLILFEFSRNEPESITDVSSNYGMLVSSDFDICILNTGSKKFGNKREIHIWIRPEDYENANLMILLSYIIWGHPEWRRGFIKVFVTFPREQMRQKYDELTKLIKQGRIPISPTNVEMVLLEEGEHQKEVVSRRSLEADLTLIGFAPEQLREGVELFKGYGDMGNILFVSSAREKVIE